MENFKYSPNLTDSKERFKSWAPDELPVRSKEYQTTSQQLNVISECAMSERVSKEQNSDSNQQNENNGLLTNSTQGWLRTGDSLVLQDEFEQRKSDVVVDVDSDTTEDDLHINENGDVAEDADHDVNVDDDSDEYHEHEDNNETSDDMPMDLVLHDENSSNLTCPLCGKKFDSHNQLVSHSRSHNRPVSCDICSIRFSSQGSLLLHQRFVHAVEKYNHTCEVCGETMRLKQDLMSHYQTHRLTKGVVRCKGCHQSFKNTVLLKLHEINLCPKKNLANDSSEQINSDQEQSVPKERNNRTHERHVGIEDQDLTAQEKAPVNIDENDFSNRLEMDDSVGISGNNCQTYWCPFCPQKFHSKGLFTIHTKKHTKPHACDVCSRGFAKKFTMECHRKTHFSQKDHQCDLCGQAFTLRPQLMKHMVENHESGFSCDDCAAKFKCENMLKRHRAYYCIAASNNDKSDQNKDGTHKCSECNKMLENRWALEQHIKYHQRRFTCNMCGNKYGERFILQSHLLTHLGIRPYKCNICGSAFTMKAHCERHCRMHLRSQNFECGACGYMFRYEQDRQMHNSGYCAGRREEQPDLRKMMSVERPDLEKLGITSSMLGYSSNTPPANAKWSSPTNNKPQENASIDTIAENDNGLLAAKRQHTCKECGKMMRKKALLLVHLAQAHSIGKEPFQCYICGLGAAFKKSMLTHLESHIPYKIFRCTVCRTRFTNRRALQTHVLGEKCSNKDTQQDSENDGDIEVEYVVGELALENQIDLQDSLNDEQIKQEANSEDNDATTYEDGGFEKSRGGETFDANLKIKEEIVDDDDSSTVCGSDDNEDRQVNLNKDRNGPLRLVCVIKREKNGIDYSISNSSISDQPEIMKDNNCSGSLQNPALKQPLHIKVLRDHKGNERVLVNGTSAAEWCNMALHASRTGEVSARDFKEWCSICKKFILGKYKYRVHMQRHSKNRPFACEICAKTFKTTENLKTHLRWHDPSRLISCELCGAKCVSPSDMARHMTVHEGIKPYSCTTCGKAFRRKIYLNTHMRTHTGEMPFTCNVCGRQFRIYSSLHDHQKLHNGNKPFECSICHKRFAQRANWRTHERRHNGIKNFECEVCHKGFVQNYELQNHRLRCVKQDLPYTCLLCGMKFTKEHPLKRHIGRHSCGCCGKQFDVMKEKISHQLKCRRSSSNDKQ